MTTGGGESHFEIGAHPGFDVLSQPLQATAIYCGLNWLSPPPVVTAHSKCLPCSAVPP
ncbi:hypothetical protein ACUOAQ_23275 [Escherichia sp. SP-MK]